MTFILALPKWVFNHRGKGGTQRISFDGVRQTVSGIRQNADDEYLNFVQTLLFEYSHFLFRDTE